LIFCRICAASALAASRDLRSSMQGWMPPE
jgi:hypothetical protein